MANILGPIGNLADHAHRYAQAGLDIFPVQPNKQPYASQKQATTNHDTIAAWWDRWPDALIGHRVHRDQLVIDIDPRHNGNDTWRALKAAIGDTFPATRAHQSGRGDGGGHTWWLHPHPDRRPSIHHLNAWAQQRQVGEPITTTSGHTRWNAGIDILHHDHRYTILPPSPHPDTGKPYTWITGRDLTLNPAPLPDLLTELLFPDPTPTEPTTTPTVDADPDSIANAYSTNTSWNDLLPRHGWTLIAGDGDSDGSRWRHPTATHPFSATIRHHTLFVHSTSTAFEPTEPGQPRGYTPFRAYAILEHGGDLSAAGRHLRRDQTDRTRARTNAWLNSLDIDEWQPPPNTGPKDTTAADDLFDNPDRPQPDQNIDQFLAEPDAEYDWLIPGLIERLDRLILTGLEGGGKSTMLRQLAFQAAAGIHPLDHEHTDPIRVLLIDLENSVRQVRRKLRPLRSLAGERLTNPDNLLIRVISQGLDLQQAAHVAWLDERLDANRPDLLLIGPLYKLANGDPTEETVAKHVSTALDVLRVKYGFALIMEAHSPHATGSGRRPERPYGASLWMRWPEFGIYLSPDGELRHWRGQRDERQWPPRLTRGEDGEWPWVVPSGQAATFAQALSIVRDLGRVPSNRELGRLLECSEATVRRMLSNNERHWNDFIADYE